MVERRNKHEIIYDIVSLISRENGKIKPTHILYGGNLSHKRMKKYLDELILKGFIEKTDESGKTYYILTEKGKKFLDEYKKVNEMINAFGI